MSSVAMRAGSAAVPESGSAGATDAPEPFDALACGASAPVSRFRFDVVTGEWWWSPEMFALHGYTAGEVEPSTELLLSHKHPEDRPRTEGTLRGVLATGEPFCCRHRILDTAGDVREVLSVGEGICDDRGNVIAVHGYFVDLTSRLAAGLAEETRRAVHRLAASRAVMEQAKGILIAAYRLDPGAAFELLGWSSQQTQVEVRALAQGLVSEFSAAHTNEVSPALRAGGYLGLLADPEG